MDAKLAHDVLRIDEHVDQMRDGRALVAADVGHARLQQRLGDGQDAFAAEGFAVAELERLHLFLERAFHGRVTVIGWGPNYYRRLALHIFSCANVALGAAIKAATAQTQAAKRDIMDYLPRFKCWLCGQLFLLFSSMSGTL